MRKIASLVIGAFVAGSSTPTASKYATLPCRATSSTAPGIIPFSTPARSVAVMRSSRSVDRPTCSGLARGRLWAAAPAAVTTHSSAATAASVLRVMDARSRIMVSLPLCRPRLARQLPELRDHPQRLVAGGDPLDVVERVAERAAPVLPRRPRHVGRERDVLELEERVVLSRRLLEHDVEPGGEDLSRRERPVEGLLVHDGAAARVDEQGARLHHRELVAAHHAARPLGQRDVQR